MKTVRLTTAAALVRFLKSQYVARDGREDRLIHGVFGIFGHGNVTGLGQALEEYGGRELPFLQPKSEQAMVHTAIAFAKTRRGLGTYACTTSVGPGATNMITGAATATINRLPVLLLPGDIFANRRPAPVLQQLEHSLTPDASVNDCFRPVSRFWDRINRPEQLLASLPEAMRILADPALTGAVTIALPEDVQAEAAEYPESFFEKRVWRQARRLPASEELEAAAHALRGALRPVVVAGGGVYYSAAEEALRGFAGATGIPVTVTQAGKGVLADTHPLALGAIGTTGTPAANQLAVEADLVLAIGTRLSDFTTASKTQFQNPAVRFVSINVNGADAAKHGSIALPGDARETLLALGKLLSGSRASDQYGSEVSAARERWHRERDLLMAPGAGPLQQSQVIRILNDQMDSRSTIVHAAGGLPGDLHKLWVSRHSGDYHSEYGYSCMGYEIAGALGVKLADPEREVYAVLGDGSYLMLNHELVTSVQEGRKITVLLLDNHGYQCIHNLQRGSGSASFGNEFRARDPERQRLEGDFVKVDFVANARSLGAHTFVAHDEATLVGALSAARRERSTCLIYVEVAPSKHPGYSWWDVPVAEVSGRAEVKTARAAYDEHRKKQRYYYGGNSS